MNIYAQHHPTHPLAAAQGRADDKRVPTVCNTPIHELQTFPKISSEMILDWVVVQQTATHCDTLRHTATHPFTSCRHSQEAALKSR